MVVVSSAVTVTMIALSPTTSEGTVIPSVKSESGDRGPAQGDAAYRRARVVHRRAQRHRGDGVAHLRLIDERARREGRAEGQVARPVIDRQRAQRRVGQGRQHRPGGWVCVARQWAFCIPRVVGKACFDLDRISLVCRSQRVGAQSRSGDVRVRSADTSHPLVGIGESRLSLFCLRISVPVADVRRSHRQRPAYPGRPEDLRFTGRMRPG